MEWRFGLYGQERVRAKVIEWNEKDGYGFCVCNDLSCRIAIRDPEIMVMSGEFHLSTDDIAKNIELNCWIDCLVIETPHGLMGLRIRICEGKRDIEIEERSCDDGWDDYIDKMPTFVGSIQHYNTNKGFGFIESDYIRTHLFFHKTEVLVPYKYFVDPYKAVSYRVYDKDLVRFQCIKNPRGIRAVAIKKLKDLKGDGDV